MKHSDMTAAFRRWVQHAFAVNGPAVEPSPQEADVVERLCREVVRRGLTVPALAMLEMSRPMNYLGAQALHYFAPLISAVARSSDHRHLASFLERRDAFERLCRRIEELSAAAGGR